MKLINLFAILIFGVLSKNFSSGNVLIIECNFHLLDFMGVPKEYGCQIENTEIFVGNRINVTDVIGTHQLCGSNDVVKYLYLDDANVKLFPRNFDKVFKNLILINFLSTKLTEITQDDLKVFPELKILYLVGNKIKTIREDLFAFNPLLEEISFDGNSIEYIDSKAFSGLNNLRTLELYGSYCIFLSSKSANTREKVLEMIKKIENKQCQFYRNRK